MEIFKPHRRIAALLLAFALVLSMNGLSSYVSAKSPAVKISQKKLVLTAGKSKKLNITGAKNAKTTWKSSNKKVASVSKNGKVNALKKGTAKITASVKLKTKKSSKVNLQSYCKGKERYKQCTRANCITRTSHAGTCNTGTNYPGAFCQSK